MTRTKTARRTLVAACVLTMTVTACATSKSGGDGVSSVGVTDDEIRLGILTDITGPFKALSAQQNLGVKLYWDKKNAEGGACGRRVAIDTRDHGYDPQKAVSLAAELNGQVLAYQITVGSPPTAAIQPELEDGNIMAISMSWSPLLGQSPSLVIPGTYYSAEMVAALDYLVGRGDLRSGDTVGHVYFAGDYGEPALEGLRHAAERNGITVEATQIDPSVSDLTTQVTAFRAKGVAAIFANTSATQLASLAGLTEVQGLSVPLVSSAPGYAPQLLDTNVASALQERTLVVGSVAAFDSDEPAVVSVRQLYDQSGTTVPPSQWVVAGYAAAAIMDEAMSAACAGGDLNRETLAGAFHSGLTADTRGATVDLNYTKAGKSPSNQINILRPVKGVPGGLTTVEANYVGPDVEGFLSR